MFSRNWKNYIVQFTFIDRSLLGQASLAIFMGMMRLQMQTTPLWSMTWSDLPMEQLQLTFQKISSNGQRLLQESGSRSCFFKVYTSHFTPAFVVLIVWVWVWCVSLNLVPVPMMMMMMVMMMMMMLMTIYRLPNSKRIYLFFSSKRPVWAQIGSLQLPEGSVSASLWLVWERFWEVPGWFWKFPRELWVGRRSFLEVSCQRKVRVTIYNCFLAL